MSEVIPPVPDVIDATNEWNKLPHSAREVALAVAVSQSLLPAAVEVEPARENDAVKAEEIADFWEKGYVAPLPTFADAIKEAKAKPEKYSTIIRKRPSHLLNFVEPHGRGNRLATNLQMTERDALTDMDRFLNEASNAAHELGLEDTAKLAGDFKEKVGYLSEADFNHATELIAESLAAYVKSGKDNVINLFVENQFNFKKSRDLVNDRVLDELQRLLADDPETASRIITDPDKWRGGDKAKLIVLEDWAMTGTQFRGPVGVARQAAESRGLNELTQQTEVHLLASPKGRLAEEDFKVRSVYVHDNNEHVLEYSLTGWHSSVDYGFEETLDRILNDLNTHGRMIRPPHLYYLDRQYRPEYNDDQLKTTDWNRISNLAQEQYALLDEYDELRAEKAELLRLYRKADKDGKGQLNEQLEKIELRIRDMYDLRESMDEEIRQHRSKVREN